MPTERLRLRCGACGYLCWPKAFGVGENGEFFQPPVHPTEFVIAVYGGRGSLHWRSEPISINIAKAQLACYEAAARRLRVEIQMAEQLET